MADRITAAAGKAESEPAKQGLLFYNAELHVRLCAASAIDLDQSSALFADAPGPSNTATPAANSSAFVDLGQNRRAAVSNFKGNMLLNLREYYLKGGEVHCHCTPRNAWLHVHLLQRSQRMRLPLDCSGIQAKRASA